MHYQAAMVEHPLIMEASVKHTAILNSVDLHVGQWKYLHAFGFKNYTSHKMSKWWNKIQ